MRMQEAADGVERVRSETGGEKDKKLPELGAIDAKALLELAKVAGHGARKYSRHNFLKGYPHSLSVDALYRHLLADQSGEDLDPESGLPHLAHAAWHALAILGQRLHGVGTDDRFVPKGQAEPEGGRRGPNDLRAAPWPKCPSVSHVFYVPCLRARYHPMPHENGAHSWHDAEQAVTP